MLFRSPLPHLIFVDGGRGHLSAGKSVLTALKLSIPITSMVKDERHRTRGLVCEVYGEIREVLLKNRSLLFSYIEKFKKKFIDLPLLITEIYEMEGV